MVADDLAGEGAELPGQPRGQRAAQRHGGQEQGADGEVAETRLQEVEEDAAGRQPDHAAGGDQGRAQQQECRYRLTAHQPDRDREVTQPETADERPGEPDRGQCRVEGEQGSERVLDQVPSGLPGDSAPGREIDGQL